MTRPARSRRSTVKATFRPSSRVYFRPRPKVVTSAATTNASAGAASFAFAAQSATIKTAPSVGSASFGMAAQNATVKIAVNAEVAEFTYQARNAIPVQNIACAWFEATVTVDQHFCTVDLDSCEGSITLDAHEGVVGLDAYDGEVVICGRE